MFSLNNKLPQHFPLVLFVVRTCQIDKEVSNKVQSQNWLSKDPKVIGIILGLLYCKSKWVTLKVVTIIRVLTPRLIVAGPVVLNLQSLQVLCLQVTHSWDLFSNLFSLILQFIFSKFCLFIFCLIKSRENCQISLQRHL